MQKSTSTKLHQILATAALTLLIFIALSPRRAQAEMLYAASGSLGTSGELYILDPTDGSVLVDVGPLNDRHGNNYSITGLRYDSDNAIFYGATAPSSPFDPAYLVTINPVTARVTPIGPMGTRMTDLAYDPTTGNMYGVSGSSDGFYTIDLNTGAATALGHTGVHPQEGGGLAEDSEGVIYGVTGFTFYTYNKDTGAATKIGPTRLQLFVRALAFDSTDTLYGIDGTSLDSYSNLRNLVTINRATGVATQIGPTVKNLDGLAFVPALSAKADADSRDLAFVFATRALMTRLFSPVGLPDLLARGYGRSSSLGVR